MKKKMSPKTVTFILFMLAFWGVTVFFTYASQIAYRKNLPRVSVIMPVRTENMENGRYQYTVMEDAVRTDQFGKEFLLAARFQKDILGERYRTVRIDIRIKERNSDKTVLVDGIVREEGIVMEKEIEMDEFIMVDGE